MKKSQYFVNQKVQEYEEQITNIYTHYAEYIYIFIYRVQEQNQKIQRTIEQKQLYEETNTNYGILTFIYKNSTKTKSRNRIFKTTK